MISLIILDAAAPWDLTAGAISLAVMTVGIVVLAHCAPHVVRQDEPGVLCGSATGLRAAAHLTDHIVAVNAVPVGEALKLLEINLLGQDLQRVVSLLRVTEAAQQVDQPLPVVPHLYHHAFLLL